MKWLLCTVSITVLALDFFVISDAHLDLTYVDKALPETHCRVLVPSQEERSMGQAGCDLPETLLQSAFSEAKDINSDPDFIVLPGDFFPHHLERTGVEEVRKTFRTVVEKLREHFPSSQVVLALGNNDALHLSQPSDLSADLAFLSELWTPVTGSLPTSFLSYGYYSTLTRSGHLAVSLNTNYFSIHTADHSEAANEQLNWLEAQLQAAQAENRKAILVMHHPPGPGMFRGNSYDWHACYITQFEAIVERCAGSIELMLAGHQHKDGFQLLPKSTQGVFVHAALSPVYGNNPGFRHYSISPTKQDYTDFFYRLDLAQPYWEAHFRYSDFFGLNSFDFQQMYERLAADDTEDLYQYLRFAHGLGDAATSREEFWQIAVGLEEETDMKRTALCAYKYMSNFDFELCKWGMLSTS